MSVAGPKEMFHAVDIAPETMRNIVAGPITDDRNKEICPAQNTANY
jgi:hypothetical protein